MSERARALHDSPWQGVIYLTGGGSSFISEVLSTPGASRTVLEVRIPYAAEATAELLGRTPEQACSEATARALAMSAFQRAQHLAAARMKPDTAKPTSDLPALFGLACTASLATDRPKKGEHRAHAALQTADQTVAAFWTFTGDREAEEAALREALWAKLGSALMVPGITGTVTFEDSSPVHGVGALTRTRAEPAWRDLVLGSVSAVPTAPHAGDLLLPGAFNPLHPGHREMMRVAEALTGRQGAYELSIANVDKPFLDYQEIRDRLAQLDRPAWLTRLPTFVEKARRFPNATFIVGLDTLLRIAEPRYYGSPGLRDEALQALAEGGTRFLVFGRTINGTFQTLDDVRSKLPALLLAQSTGIGENQFRHDVSSTDIRGSRGGPEDSD